MPLRSSSAADSTGKIVRSISLGYIDLSGLHYDSANDQLLVVSDATNTFCQITRTGRILRLYAFPGANQEGIAMDSDGFLYIAQDSGGIVKIKWVSGK